MNEHIAEKLSLENNLRRALDKGEIGASLPAQSESFKR
jgi:hypothetical protein